MSKRQPLRVHTTFSSDQWAEMRAWADRQVEPPAPSEMVRLLCRRGLDPVHDRCEAAATVLRDVNWKEVAQLWAGGATPEGRAAASLMALDALLRKSS